MGPEQRLGRMIDLVQCAKEKLANKTETYIDSKSICITLLRIIVGHIIDYPMLPFCHANVLGCELIKTIGEYLHDDRILWGLITFVWISLKDGTKLEIADVQQHWETCLTDLATSRSNTLPNISFLLHFIRKPGSKFSSPANAVCRLYRINSKIKPRHGHAREPVVQIASKFNTLSTPKFDVEGTDVDLLRQSLATFEEIVECTGIIGIGGLISATELGKLLQSKDEIDMLRSLSDPGCVVEKSRKNKTADLVAQIQTHYTVLYDTWFPGPVNVSSEVLPQRLPRILTRFSVNFRECWESAWKDFSGKDYIHLGPTDVLDCNGLCDTLLITNAFGQYLENLLKHRQGDSDIHVSFSQSLGHDGRLGVRLANSGTSSKDQNGYGGLTHFRWKLEEYGGSLEWGCVSGSAQWQVTLICYIPIGAEK